jgi:hypothetical protein
MAEGTQRRLAAIVSADVVEVFSNSSVRDGAISIESAEEVKAMAGIRPDVDPDGLLEYSVVFTDRALNHMSQAFQGVMRDISATLKGVYGAAAIAIVTGGGSVIIDSMSVMVKLDVAKAQLARIIHGGALNCRQA